jgi:dTDP-4-amino-4,6-dideoxygalactose transaminase
VPAASMHVPLLDLKVQYAAIRAEIRTVIDAVLDSQYFVLGANVGALETEVARYCGVPHAVGVASGSDALLLALMAIGIGPGDEVITTPYTFFATAAAVVRLGGVPVFVDVEPMTLNLAVEQVKAHITARTKAIIPVHLYGQCADMAPLLALAQEHGLMVIEDAAQVIGARYLLPHIALKPDENAGMWCRAGAMGDLGCLSGGRDRTHSRTVFSPPPVVTMRATFTAHGGRLRGFAGPECSPDIGKGSQAFMPYGA